MGNGGSLSAGLSFQEEQTVEQIKDENRVRHRQNINNNHIRQVQDIGASIVEKESGAYISRSTLTFDATTEALPKCGSELEAQHPDDDREKVSSKDLCSSSSSTRDAMRPINDTGSMNDSGYLDLETGLRLTSHTSDNSLLTVKQMDRDSALSLLRVSSDRSSLSDQAIHDLVSDNSSCQSSQLADNLDEEDLLSVELYDNVESDADLASMNTLLGSTARSSDETCESSLASTDITLYSSSQPEELCHSDAKDTWTDSSDLWRELDDVPSPFSPSPRPLVQGRDSMENLQISSAHSSPLFVPKSNHSRTSSITSADIGLEAGSIDSQVS